MTPEHVRLDETTRDERNWRRWGPYLSERQWGTVREDYSFHGDAWDYLTHDAARSRAYRWGEDGIAGVSDDEQQLCLSIALWNGTDPILKERLFGLTNSEGNHGEDVKEYYYYLDALPTHAYLKYLYKYPHREFPYRQLVDENRRRGRSHPRPSDRRGFAPHHASGNPMLHLACYSLRVPCPTAVRSDRVPKTSSSSRLASLH